ncbi:T6SS effector BTH_I2691 family protein [Acinetobacter venetianus]
MTTNQQIKLKTSNTTNSKLIEALQQQKKKQAQIPKLGQTKPVGDMRIPTVAKDVKKKIEQSEIAKSAKQSTAANIQNNSAGQVQKECSNFCRKMGFNILPLRYTVVTSTAPALPATLGKNVKEIQLSHFKYAVEMIDTGYIYRLVKRASGALEWAGYLVTPKGHLSYFPVGKEAPKSVPEFACKGAGHSVNSSLINLESNPKDEVKIAYLIHTHDPMSKLKLKEYENNAEKFAAEGKWQKFIVEGGVAQAHCLAASNVKNSIYNVKSFGAGRIDQILKKFAQEPNNVACMALYDPIGITLKLNASRNARFEKLTKYIAEKDNKTTNEHKLHSSQLVDSIKIVIENKLINQGLSTNTLQADLSAKLIFAQDKIPLFGSMDQRDYQSKVNEIWDRASPQEKEKFLQQYNKKYAAGQKQVRDKIISQSKAKAKLDWETKYSTKIDWTAKNAFDDKVKALTDEARKSAQAYASDHLQWLQSKQLLKAFYTYDQTVLKGDGALFHIKVLSLINGMTGCDQGQALMEKWLGVDKISDDNLYMRAVTYNQKSLIDQYNAKSPEITSLTWDQSQSSLKGLIAAFVSADQLWEQWLADPNNKVNDLKWYNPAKTLPWISEITRSVAKWSLQYNASPLIAKKLSRVSFIAYAHSSLLTDKVPKWSLLYNIDLKMTNAASQLNATEIQKRWKNAGQNTAAQKIKEILSKSPVSVALRISGIVAVFELMNLGTQASLFAGDRNWENGFKVTAGLFASAAAVLDIAGGGMAALSFEEKANKIKHFSAWLAIGGATFSLFVETIGFVKEYKGDQNAYIMVLSFGKVVSSFIMVGVGVGLLLNLPQLSTSKAVQFANRYALGRVLLAANFIKITCYINWIGLALTGIDIILRNYWLDDEMQKWCKKSSFGLDSNKFKSMTDEEEAFSKAIVSI